MQVYHLQFLPVCKLRTTFSSVESKYCPTGVLQALHPKAEMESSTHKSRILIEAGFHKLLEGLAVVTFKCWRVIFGDQEENPHRMEVRIWRLSLC